MKRCHILRTSRFAVCSCGVVRDIEPSRFSRLDPISRFLPFVVVVMILRRCESLQPAADIGVTDCADSVGLRSFSLAGSDEWNARTVGEDWDTLTALCSARLPAFGCARRYCGNCALCLCVGANHHPVVTHDPSRLGFRIWLTRGTISPEAKKQFDCHFLTPKWKFRFYKFRFAFLEVRLGSHI